MGCKYLSLPAVNCLWYQSLLLSSSFWNVTFEHQVNNKVFYISEVCIFVQFYPVIDIILFETSFACGDIHISFCSSGQMLRFYILFIWYNFPEENVPVSYRSFMCIMHYLDRPDNILYALEIFHMMLYISYQLIIFVGYRYCTSSAIFTCI